MDVIAIQQKISKYLKDMFDIIEMQNLAGDFSLNKVAENLFRDVLNIAFDYKLQNTNLNIANYPAIDLISTNNSRICYQVTSTNNIAKIKNTLNSFFKKGMEADFDSLFFIILKSSKDYRASKFNRDFKDLILSHNVINFRFDLKVNVIDKNMMYNLIVNSCNPAQLHTILEVLKCYYEGYQVQTDLTKYYEEIKESFHEIVMDDEKGMTLNDIYIDPDFQYYRPIILLNDEDLTQHRLEDFIDLSIPTSDIMASLLNNKTDLLKATFKNPNAIVTFVLGFPGQGKTSFCKKIIYEHISSGSDVPIFYLKLRSVRKTRDLIENPLSIIREELEIEVGRELNKDVLKTSIIILDGLDELYMKDNLRSEDIERFCKEIIRESERLKYLKIIITTRFGYIDFNKLYDKDYLAISLKPFTLAQQIEWLEKFKLFHEKTILSKSKLRLFNSDSDEYDFIKELINQPLLLYIIASLNINLTQDVDRAGIYNLLFEQIINRKYSKDGQIEILKNLNKEDLRSLLNEVAYLIFCSGQEYVTADDLLIHPVIKEYISKVGEKNLAGTLKGVLISFYFKESRIKTNGVENNSNIAIEFFHKSLQEYLAADKIVESAFGELLNKDTRGRYVIKYETEILIWLNDLFGKQFLTDEVASYMQSIIDKKDNIIKTELGERLYNGIEYFIEKDFLYKYENDERMPLSSIFMNFQSYWFLLQSLKLNRNYITTASINSGLISYFNAINSTGVPQYGILLSFQHFWDHQIKFLNISDSDTSYVTFQKLRMYHVSFTSSKFSNNRIENCTVYSLEMFESEMDNCVFLECDIFYLDIYESAMRNVTFTKCEFYHARKYYHTHSEIESIIFDSCLLDMETYHLFSDPEYGVVFKDCKIVDGPDDVIVNSINANLD